MEATLMTYVRELSLQHQPIRNLELKPSSFIVSHIRTWLNTPQNMASLWNLGKSILDELPAPRNILELENMVFTVGEIIIRKIEIIKAGWSSPLIGRGPLRLCSDWLDPDVAEASSLMP